MGRLLIDSDEDYQQWHESLGPSADEHPEIWFTRGMYAKRDGQLRAASRCFWETLRLYPDHIGANHQLAISLGALGEAQKAEPFADRARQLDQAHVLLSEMELTDEYLRKMIGAQESVGHDWEAAAYYYLAWRAKPTRDWATKGLVRLRGRLSGDSRIAKWRDEISKLDLASEPLPKLGGATTASSPAVVERRELSKVAFVDQAAEAGLRFQYYNGHEPDRGRVYMFEYSGGGVAVLDYDGDGWPDIYLTQGCRWPVDASQSQHQDRLYRNLGDGRYADVTESAGLGDNGMSHGVTVGDFDNDGDPDLYVANVGPNRLYRSNGDGTFSDASRQAGVLCDAWSSSCVLADLNGDALPDLYVVGYLAWNVFDRFCEADGRPVQCGPMGSDAEQDRLFLNLGDGRFRDITAECGIVVPDGKGLGVVAADFEGTGDLSLFVANDTTANFFFVNRTNRDSRRLKLAESALYYGLACDDSGASQSCMGVAAGDANEDGLLDLFVTNFTSEANALYVQTENRMFTDQVKRSDLLGPSFHMMGWGAQFIDGELDGLPDLALVNGHISDFTADGTKYKMRGQYFHNVGRGRFVEAAAEKLGAYFTQPVLGRALARLDWNRDGREDLCATHVDAPTALLTNATANTGHYLAIRLHAVKKARDAIGATVRVTASGRTQTRQLVAGDGFYASNQRLLVFGLGDQQVVERLEIMWPGGSRQVFDDVPADTEQVVVEGRESLVPWKPER